MATEAEFKKMFDFLEDEFGFHLATFHVHAQTYDDVAAEYARPGSSVSIIVERGVPEITITIGERSFSIDQARKEVGLTPVGSGLSLSDQVVGLRGSLEEILAHFTPLRIKRT